MAKASNKVNTASLEQVLNRQVANLNVLYVKVHNFHWYVKGEQFFALHVKFEELYNDITLKMDEVAERLLSIKGSPAATMKEYLEIATIQEATAKKMPGAWSNPSLKILLRYPKNLRKALSLRRTPAISRQPICSSRSAPTWRSSNGCCARSWADFSLTRNYI